MNINREVEKVLLKVGLEDYEIENVFSRNKYLQTSIEEDVVDIVKYLYTNCKMDMLDIKQLILKNKILHKVIYKQNNICEGIFSIEISDPDKPQLLNIKFTINGIFNIDEKNEKETIHIETLKELYKIAKKFTFLV